MLFFVQTSTLRPSMHRKLTKHGMWSLQNNQLPTKSRVDKLQENSIVPGNIRVLQIRTCIDDSLQ